MRLTDNKLRDLLEKVKEMECKEPPITKLEKCLEDEKDEGM